MGDYILSIDQGTTGTTVLVVNKNGQISGRGYSEFKQIYPEPGWVEHDAEEIWNVTLDVISKAILDASIKISDIAAIGITNQRETTVIWDRKTGKPVYNAIVWQCRRTTDICDKLKADGLSEKVQQKTGLVIDAYFSGTKIKWILDNVPGSRARAESGGLCFGTIDSWLIYKMSGGASHVTDYTNASRTMIYNIEDKEWDQELLDVLDIPKAILPEVKNSSGEFARTDCDVLGKGIPVTGVAGDQQAALFGQGCFEPGLVKNTYGTGCFCLIFTGDVSLRSDAGLVTTMACGPDGGPAYALEGSIFIAGAAVQWLRDELKIIDKAQETDALAQSVPDTGGVYMIPAFVGLGAPYWDSHARGGLVGLTRGSGRPQIVRSVLESIAYQSRDMVDAMQKDLDSGDTGFKIAGFRVDGGASQNDFLMQFQADILNVEVDRPEVFETAGLGAAYLSGLGVGLWPSAKSLLSLRKTQKLFTPKMKEAKRDELYKGWQKAVSRVR